MTFESNQGAQNETQHRNSKPALRQALALLAFAGLFAFLMWWEHAWRLARGDYPGIGMRHTWYWYTTISIAWLFIIGRAGWAFWRWWRS